MGLFGVVVGQGGAEPNGLLQTTGIGSLNFGGAPQAGKRFRILKNALATSNAFCSPWSEGWMGDNAQCSLTLESGCQDGCRRHFGRSCFLGG